MNPDLVPHHPRGEGCAYALFLFAITGYAMIVIYTTVRLLLEG